MKHLMWVGLGWLGLACLSAQAQVVLPPNGPPTSIACGYNSSLPTLANGNVGWVQCDSHGQLLFTGAAGAGFAITGPLGPAQAPAAAVSVVEPDDKNICDGVINTCTATGTTTLFTQDTIGYESMSVQVVSAGVGAIITYETSGDNSNWIAFPGLSLASTGTTIAQSTSGAVIELHFSKVERYFRARVSSYSSGTVTVIGTLHKAPMTILLSTMNLQASTAAIGKVGPGYTSAQTPITGNATGTTGAVVGTLAGASSVTTYICGLNVSAIGGTAAVGPITVAGTKTSSMVFQLVATASGNQLSESFTPCVPASAVNTPITITTTADGTASAVDVNSWGYQE